MDPQGLREGYSFLRCFFFVVREPSQNLVQDFHRRNSGGTYDEINSKINDGTAFMIFHLPWFHP